MADETSTVEKHYCYSCPTSDSSINPILSALLTNQNQHDPMISAMVANQNNASNQWMNNPFMYLIWLAFFGGGNGFGWGNRADAAQTTAENYNSRAIATLQDTVNNNHSNDLALQAINGNRDALGQLAQTFNTDLSSITAAVSNVQSAIQQVGGQVGFSAESVKNAIALGDSNIVSKMQECCCANKLLVTEQGYQNQLATQAQTNTLGSAIADLKSTNQLGQFQMQSALGNQINDVKSTLINGFAQVGYATQAQTNEIVQASNANTQRILDAMCNNTTQALRDEIADKDRQLQTQTIINQLSGGCNCNS